MLKETDLYAPVCSYLKKQGYEVKAEVKHCDVVALRADEPPLIVELKTRLNLELILQAADRLSLSERVYIAFPASAPLWRRHWRRVRDLCRRLGVGIITLNAKSMQLKVRLDPTPYRPRGSGNRKYRLLAEFEHRVGDNNVGGSTRIKIMTAYRQDALRCAVVLADGAHRLADIREQTSLIRAGSILQKDHYGWFERVQRGHYQLSPRGYLALQKYSEVIAQLSESP